LDDRVAFGARLRELRLAAGLSLVGLGKRIHYSKGQISKVEQGVVIASRAFASSCDQLFNTDGELARTAAVLATRRAEARRRTDKGPEPRFDLPAGPQRLIGRNADVKVVTEYLQGTVDARSARVCVLHGMAGVGKTAIALWVAESLREEFPDGCVYLDMQGYTLDSRPIEIDEALDRLLRRLGVAGEMVPPDLADREAQLRQQLANRQLLVIMDNVRDANQVVGLLPPTGHAAAIITSRQPLTSLAAPLHHQVHALAQADSVELFRSVAQLPTGSDERGDPATIEEITALCFGLPLALCIVAARFRDNRARRLEDVALRLKDHGGRFREFDDGLRSVGAVLAASCATLADTQQVMLALLALHPGPRVDARAAAALAGTTASVAEDLLDSLIRAGMLESHSHNAYRLHDLLRDYLRQPTPELLSSAEAEAGKRRLFDYYLHTAAAADMHIDTNRYRLPLELPAPGVTISSFPDAESAKQWMSDELDNFHPVIQEIAAQGEHARCWQFAYNLRGYFYGTKQWELMISCFEQALASATMSGSQQAVAIILNNLGLANTQLHRRNEAMALYAQARRAFVVVRDSYGEANVIANHAWLAYDSGEYDAALHLANTAWDFYRRRGGDASASIALDCVARCEFQLGRLGDAENHFTQALRTYQELEFPDGDIAQLLSQLAATQLSLGKVTPARENYQQAVARGSAGKAVREVAVAFEGLSRTALAQGMLMQAMSHCESAIALFEEVGGTEDAERLRAEGPSTALSEFTPAPRDSVARRLQVLVVNTEWSSKHGGLSTFSRQLCLALAAVGVDVFCSVPDASQEEHQDAEAAGVHLVHPPAGLDRSDVVLRRPPKFGGELRPDVVVGHGRVSGQAAVWLVEDHYRDAKLINFLHVVPDRLEFEKDHGADGDPMDVADERGHAELAIASRAHLAVGVGPVLYHYLVDRLHGAGGPRAHRLDPGFDLTGEPADPPPRSDTVRVLLLGRLNRREAQVKGVDIAARALGRVLGQRSADDPTIELVLRGVETGQGQLLRDAVHDWAGTPALRVVPRPFAADGLTLQQDLRQASVVLMPSRAEGFGLVGLESIIMGVPTLISRSSGLGSLLSEERDNLSVELTNRVIPVTDNEEIDALRWSDAVLAVLNNPKPAFAAARMLRADMAELRTWQMAATTLVDAIRALVGLRG
jgi:glycosyltransferase involved in cell wall biosynthesis/tetratricopeptide (TPR) repeat protein/transcriptional regulator with XRE-family HTH domain